MIIEESHLARAVQKVQATAPSLALHAVAEETSEPATSQAHPTHRSQEQDKNMQIQEEQRLEKRLLAQFEMMMDKRMKSARVNPE